MAYSKNDFARELGEFHPVSRETLARLEAYAAILIEWQKKINLIGKSTENELWQRHMLDSAQLMDYLPKNDRARKIVDLGSGAGFPGLVLAILGAGHVHMIESDERKCAFLRAAARAADAQADITVHNDRIENIAPFIADVITARAFAPLERLIPLADKFSDKNTTWLLLKGQDIEEELTKHAIYRIMKTELHKSRSDKRGFVLVMHQHGTE